MKKSVLSLIIISFIFSLVACNQTEEVFDMGQFEQDIIGLNPFAEELNSIDDQRFTMIYGIDNYEVKSAYLSSGAVSDEFVLLKLKDAKDAESSLEKLKARVDEQKAAFENYLPAQVPKLENAIVKAKDEYLVLLVTENEAARTLVSKYFK